MSDKPPRTYHCPCGASEIAPSNPATGSHWLPSGWGTVTLDDAPVKSTTLCPTCKGRVRAFIAALSGG